MEYLCRINWKNLNSQKEIEDAIIDWLDRDNLDDINSITRIDILKLISIHHLENQSKIQYDTETGFSKIELTCEGKEFYGIKSKFNLLFNFPEFGEHLTSMMVNREYGKLEFDFFKQAQNLQIA